MSEHDDQTMPETDEDRDAAEPDDADGPDPAGPEDTTEDESADETDEGDPRQESEEDARRRREEFAREHDPADHDVEAGEEFRQPGDWTADEDGPQELETDRSMLAAPGSSTTAEGGSAESGADGSGAGEGSSEEEIRDGGHGWGSAAPQADGTAPEGHPVKAWHDTMTFVLPDEAGYDAEAHECFVDAETAERAGFRHAHG
ncbi:hypothetical protein [Serinicoccus chungangensis]|uniref:sunset domain-containing protein n=1 Tax=Serinicoccus chungangensis TaxID=767452 RepID=UPI001117E10C|nr:hypothetical protein [Serinicoccus chungangensis]